MEKQVYFCFDVGGTYIKSGVVNEDGEILFDLKTPTMENLKTKTLAQIIFDIIKNLEEISGVKLSDVTGVGIGVPGRLDLNTGDLLYANNLKIKDYQFKKELENITGYNNFRIQNDAYVATLAEKKAGAGRNIDNFVMLTLGTGVGGGIVIDGNVLEKSCELGHIKIPKNENLCSCGEIGCLESASSTQNLVLQTKLAMENNKNSKMWQTYTLETVSGKTVFDYLDDEAAKTVFEKFIESLGDGISSLVNIFDPDVVIIGGTISLQKENLTKPLEEYVNKHIYSKNAGIKVKIIPAELTKDAGIIGARYMFE